MFNRGFSKKQIFLDLPVAPRTVGKISGHFQRYGTLSAFPHGESEPRKVMDDVLQCIDCIEIWKLQKEYAYRVQDSNNQSIIAFLKRLAGSMVK